jgi:hypothetical protein
MVDAGAGVLGLEWIDGESVRVLLGDDEDDSGRMAEYGVSQGMLLYVIYERCCNDGQRR